MSYDPLGRLHEVSTSSGVTRFVYDGDRLIAEYNGSGAVLRRYVHGAGIDEPLVWYEGASVSATNRQYLHADYQGSIIATTSASGATLQKHTYDPYGVTSTSNTWRFQYTGQAAIPEVGLLYYKARFYNPSLGRFMQTDPIGYEDDVNLYAYVKNDPFNKTDPLGLADYDCSSPGKGNCDLNAVVDKGDTIKLRGVTYNIHSVEGRTVTVSANSATSTGAPQTINLGNDFSGVASLANSAATVTSVPAAAAQHLGGKTRIGSNGQIYRSTARGGVFKGNKSVSTTSLAKLGRGVGSAATGVTVAADTYNVATGQIGKDKYALNMSVIGVSAWVGGPFGAALSITYFGGDALLAPDPNHSVMDDYPSSE